MDDERMGDRDGDDDCALAQEVADQSCSPALGSLRCDPSSSRLTATASVRAATALRFTDVENSRVSVPHRALRSRRASLSPHLRALRHDRDCMRDPRCWRTARFRSVNAPRAQLRLRCDAVRRENIHSACLAVD